MVEIRLAAAEGQSAPKDTYVNVRIGDTQKFSRFDASRVLRFPDPGEDRRGFGVVEVFRRVGRTVVHFDNADGKLQDVEVSLAGLQGLSDGKLDMRVALDASAYPEVLPSSVPVKKRGRAKQLMASAHKYLAEYRLEEILADAVSQVIASKPQDPYAFISRHILQHASCSQHAGELLATEGSHGGPLQKQIQAVNVADFRSMPVASWAACHARFVAARVKEMPSTPDNAVVSSSGASVPAALSAGSFAKYYCQHVLRSNLEIVGGLYANFALAPGVPAGIAKDMFNKIDRDHNGLISQDEFAPIAEATGVSFSAIDINNDGVIDVEEFEKFAKEFERVHGSDIRRLQEIVSSLGADEAKLEQKDNDPVVPELMVVAKSYVGHTEDLHLTITKGEWVYVHTRHASGWTYVFTDVKQGWVPDWAIFPAKQ